MIKHAKLIYVRTGICYHHYMTAKERKTIPQIYDCLHWAIADGTEETYDIASSLHEIAIRLKDIDLILRQQNNHDESSLTEK